MPRFRRTGRCDVSAGYGRGRRFEPGAVLAQFKGSVFLSTRIFTERTYGAEGLNACMQRLEPADRQLLEGVGAVGWYPVEPILRFHHALEAEFGSPSYFRVCEQAGRFSAEWAFNSILKTFLRFKSPKWLMDKAGAVWDRHHDSGRWEVGPKKSDAIWGRLHDFEVQDPAFCARLRGWLQGAVEMTGGRDVRVLEPRCKCQGAPYCQFEASWR